MHCHRNAARPGELSALSTYKERMPHTVKIGRGSSTRMSINPILGSVVDLCARLRVVSVAVSLLLCFATERAR